MSSPIHEGEGDPGQRDQKESLLSHNYPHDAQGGVEIILGGGQANQHTRKYNRRIIIPILVFLGLLGAGTYIALIFIPSSSFDPDPGVFIALEFISKGLPIVCLLIFTILFHSMPVRTTLESLSEISEDTGNEGDYNYANITDGHGDANTNTESESLRLIKRESDTYYRCIVAGLIFGLIGDLMLQLAHFIVNNRIVFIGGAAFFFIGHLFYIYAFTRCHSKWMLLRWIPSLLVLVIALIVIIPKTLSFGVMNNILLALYVLIESVMVWRSMARIGTFVIPETRENVTSQWIGGIGSLVFMVSDVILGYDIVSPLGPWGGVAIMVTYWIGQTSIAITTHRSTFKL